MSPLATPAREPTFASIRDQPDSAPKYNATSNATRSCRYAGCLSTVLTVGEYCLRHKSSEKMAGAAHLNARNGQAAHPSGPGIQPSPARSSGGSDHPARDSGRPSGTINMDTERPPSHPPAAHLVNSKKQLQGRSIARKSIRGSRPSPGVASVSKSTQGQPASLAPMTKTPNIVRVIDESSPDSRPSKRLCVSPILSGSTREVDSGRPLIGSGQVNGPPNGEFSLHPKDTDASISNGADPHDRNSHRASSAPDKPPMQGEPPTFLHISNGHVHLQHPRESEEVQAPTQVSVLNKASPVSKDKAKENERPANEQVNPSHISLNLGRRYKPLDPERLSGQFPESRSGPSLSGTDLVRFTSAPGPPSATVVSSRTEVPPVKEPETIGFHTAARFAIVEAPPTQNGRKSPAEGSHVTPTPTSQPGSSTSLKRSPPKAPPSRLLPASPRTLSTQFKNQLTNGNSATQAGAQAVPLRHNQKPRANEFTFIMKGLAERTRQAFSSPSARRKKALDRHDPDKFDSYIYGKANEACRPGTELFGKPWYERPARSVHPATNFAHIDPRVHWSQPRRPQRWYENKQAQIAERGGRKARLGGAAASAARRKREDRSADCRVKMPERVENNPGWLAALDELDAMVEANRLRELGVDVGVGNAAGGQKQNHVLKQTRKRKRGEKLPSKPRQGNKAPPPHLEQETQQRISTPAPTGEEQPDDMDDGEFDSPAEARQRRQSRRKGKARATMIVDDSDYDGGEDDDHAQSSESDV